MGIKGFMADYKAVGLVGALRRSNVSKLWTAGQELRRIVSHPKLYFSEIQLHPSGQALIIVDMINGFLRKDARLYMKGVARDIIERTNRIIEAARKEGIPIFYLCDNHLMTDEEMKNWPKHCAKNSWEAQIHPKVSQPARKSEKVKKNAFSAFAGVVQKQQVSPEELAKISDLFINPDSAYLVLKRDVDAKRIAESAASDNIKRILIASLEVDDLHARLQKLGVKSTTFLGVATEYCDEANTTAAIDLGYDVSAVSDSIRAVDLQPGDGDKATWRMVQKGVKFIDTAKAIEKIERREYMMPFEVTPTKFLIGPSVAANARPIVTIDMVGKQAAYTASLNFRRNPFAAWLTQTDLYQLVMLNLFRQICHGTTPIAHFEAYFKKLPADRNYMMLSGLHEVLYWLKTATLDEERIQYILSRPIIKESKVDLRAFADFLRNFRFHLDVWSFLEGSFYGPIAPYFGASGPVEEILLAETFTLAMLNSRSAFSTRAAQFKLANPGVDLLSMEMRRMDPVLSEVASFEAYLQGFFGTSNVEAGFQYGINSVGTNSHGMYLMFDKEIDAIRAWMDIYPNYPMVLADTFHTLINALKTTQVLQEKMMGSTSYRVDSGHLKKLMDLYNRILEMNGISTKLKIATNDLTPLAIAEMLEQQCLANVLGAGTQLGQVPATPGVLKASVVNGPFGSRFIGKISAGKGNLPGIHQVWRVFDSNGHAVKDIIALLDEDIPGAVPMMKPFMSGGYLLGAYPDKEALRQQYAAGRDALPGVILDAGGRFVEGYNYPVELTSRAQALRDQVVKEIEAREIAPYQQQLLTYVTPEELAAVGL